MKSYLRNHLCMLLYLTVHKMLQIVDYLFDFLPFKNFFDKFVYFRIANQLAASQQNSDPNKNLLIKIL